MRDWTLMGGVSIDRRRISLLVAMGHKHVITYRSFHCKLQIYVDYEPMGRTVKKGGNVLLDDGIIKLEVMEPIVRSYTGEDPMKVRPCVSLVCGRRPKECPHGRLTDRCD